MVDFICMALSICGEREAIEIYNMKNSCPLWERLLSSNLRVVTDMDSIPTMGKNFLFCNSPLFRDPD